jgi:hypothetical protein
MSRTQALTILMKSIALFARAAEGAGSSGSSSSGRRTGAERRAWGDRLLMLPSRVPPHRDGRLTQMPFWITDGEFPVASPPAAPSSAGWMGCRGGGCGRDTASAVEPVSTGNVSCRPTRSTSATYHRFWGDTRPSWPAFFLFRPRISERQDQPSRCHSFALFMPARQRLTADVFSARLCYPMET